ncbi:MAG: type II toxin-antitoxin system RelE/ParE family toxin [bacterium]
MARYRIVIKASAAREIEEISSRGDRRRVVDRIAALAEDPRPRGCEKLSGRDIYRIRQGPYRILYSLQDEQLVVHVVKVGHRRDVYKG